jgi:putative membrane protein
MPVGWTGWIHGIEEELFLMKKPDWRTTGERPDYRFSLANERTFLAWVRTALALLAGAVAVNQLASALNPVQLRTALCVLLAVFSGVLAFVAYRRWAAQEKAMRNNEDLPHSWVLLGMAGVVGVSAIAFLVLLFWR